MVIGDLPSAVWKSGPEGRLAKSLITLVDQVDAIWPGRDKSTDGSIGDAAHRARQSDHNPNAADVVTALDLDRDIAAGFTARNLAEMLVASRDPRIKYVISNGQIISSKQTPWVWRPYTGENAHREHIHVSVDADPALYDDARPWAIGVQVPKTQPLQITSTPLPLLKMGDSGPFVSELQRLLGIAVSGVFDAATDAAVRAFQTRRGLFVDGRVGNGETWPALLGKAPVAAAGLTPALISQIIALAGASELARYSWADRGKAPAGYIKGMAVTFAKVYLDWKAMRPSAWVMASPSKGDTEHDVLAWYDVPSQTGGVATLRALFALLIGLGMRESSGHYYEGRDMSASNTSADTAEAGLFQQSWNSHSASPEIPKLLAAYAAKPEGFLPIFAEGSNGASESVGQGDGLRFQLLCKACPAFAVECAAVGLRVLRKHWGPINRREAEIRPEADVLLQQVQAVVDAIPVPIDGELLPPLPGDTDLLRIIIAIILSEGDTMDANLRALLVQALTSPNPNDPNLRARLLEALGEKPPAPPPPTVSVPVQGFDFGKLLPLLGSPVLQKLLGGKPVTLSELLPLIPQVMTALTGQTVPALPAPTPTDTPPPVSPPSVLTTPEVKVTGFASVLAILAQLAGVAPASIGPNATTAGILTTAVPVLLTLLSPTGALGSIFKIAMNFIRPKAQS